MRKKENDDHELFDAQYQSVAWSISPKNPLMKELEVIDKLLDEMPEILDLIHSDLSNTKKKETGRPTEVTCEQIIRTAILMQLRSLHYRQLADEIDVNIVYRKFTRFYGKKIPHFSTLNQLIKAISPQTMGKINEAIMLLGIKKNVEDGKAIRHDTTVTETNIAHPTDSRLLNDSVRVITRIILLLRVSAPHLCAEFHDHTRVSKKQAYRIVLAKGHGAEKKRAKAYERLLKVQKQVRGYAQAALDILQGDNTTVCSINVMALVVELETILGYADQVYDQAYRRIVLGEKVPREEKLISIFETHSDIICRGKKGSATEFGHKFDVATGRSGLVTFYRVYKGNPSDGDVMADTLEHHKKIFGNVPEKLTADRRYFSAANEKMASEAGVEEVAIPKPGRLSEIRKSLQKAQWFRRLQRFRAGVEGCLSTLLRSFGLKRCLWRSWRSFQSYVGLSIATYNLRLLAGHVALA